MGTKSKIQLIPDEILIPAVNKTMQEFASVGCCDKWTKVERAYCRKLCGDEFSHIETDWIGLRATSLRKAGKLKALHEGKRRSKYEEKSFVSEEYKNYLQSDHWRSFRLHILDFWDYSCSLCMSKKNLEVHHRTYVRLWKEKYSDCVCLCKRCHKKHHRVMDKFNDSCIGLF
jgi:hypothetical protein